MGCPWLLSGAFVVPGVKRRILFIVRSSELSVISPGVEEAITVAGQESSPLTYMRISVTSRACLLFSLRILQLASSDKIVRADVPALGHDLSSYDSLLGLVSTPRLAIVPLKDMDLIPDVGRQWLPVHRKTHARRTVRGYVYIQLRAMGEE